ncbi:MAG TPA: LuxR C-terminal-related transcriptional regulator [Solirubrobacteraceae bacterium]|nr:LuxR C-terminal-related transcriptional regulator [Solirubrobacteraceae bacterium]
MVFIDGIPGSSGRATKLERARSLVALGVALRDGGNPIAARDPLREALDLAHRCGAAVLEEQILAELRAAGARPRRRAITGAGALTRSERRIAELAAAGRQNKQIAAELVVTLDTVEFHLRNTYRKLGIKSRTLLPAALDMAWSGAGRVMPSRSSAPIAPAG